MTLDLPYRTHLDLLRAGTEQAAREGIFAVRVRRPPAAGDRPYGCQAQGWSEDQFTNRLERKLS
jgi:hypothetical protein